MTSLNTVRAFLILNTKAGPKKGSAKAKGWTDAARLKAAATRKAKKKVATSKDPKKAVKSQASPISSLSSKFNLTSSGGTTHASGVKGTVYKVQDPDKVSKHLAKTGKLVSEKLNASNIIGGYIRTYEMSDGSQIKVEKGKQDKVYHYDKAAHDHIKSGKILPMGQWGK